MDTHEDFFEFARSALNKGNSIFALRYYSEAAAGGNVEAMVELAKIYRTGIADIPKNFSEALKLLNRAAILGDASAMNLLGVMYESGEGVEASEEKSFEWCLKAANAGNAVAMYNVSYKYRTGEGVTKNIVESGVWLGHAAENGYPQAMYDLGRTYDKIRKFKQAFEWFLKAAKKGHSNAMNDVAFMYSNGRGVEKNPEEAMTWYMLATRLDNVAAIKNLAYHYGYGVNTDKNFDEAVTLYKRAIILGDVEAINGLGELYYSVKDFGEAVKYFHNAANLGNTDAMVNLYRMYGEGSGVNVNEKLASHWLQRAVSMGNNLAKANMGRLLSEAEKDGDELENYMRDKCARRLLEEAAKAGEEIAMLWLGDFWEKKKDRDSQLKAEFWYYKAAEANIPGARVKLEALKNSNSLKDD